MRTSNNIPIIEHEDIINIFTENLRTKRKEKKYTQEQLAGMLGVTVKTYRSWEQDTLPKTIDLINLSIILGCDIDYLLGRINTDTHFKAYIDSPIYISNQRLFPYAYCCFFQLKKYAIKIICQMIAEKEHKFYQYML